MASSGPTNVSHGHKHYGSVKISAPPKIMLTIVGVRFTEVVNVSVGFFFSLLLSLTMEMFMLLD